MGNTITVELIENIRKIRKMKGISQESIAYDLGIDYSTYGKIERGHIGLTVDRLEKIAQILQVPIEKMYTKKTGEESGVEESDKFREECYKLSADVEKLRFELELLRKQLFDKDKIIKLLEIQRVS